jgi:Spy/CpxP family protein refolding chaperone
MLHPAFAQGRGGGGPGGPPMGGGGMNPGGMGGPGDPRMGTNGPPPPGQPGDRPALHLGPPGRWWDDKSFAKSLKLRPEQQTRMDAIFEQNRGVLLSRLQAVQQAESQLADLTHTPAPDESTLFTRIDRLAQARAELEKANTHMLLQIRREMDADQIARLDKHR